MSKFDFLDRFNKPRPLDSDDSGLRSFADDIGGQFIVTESGKCLELQTCYDPEFTHGPNRLKSILKKNAITLRHFDSYAGDVRPLLGEMVFVDAETTGLSAASGTVAFLVGVGLVAENGFRVHQFFLPDYPDEPAQLDLISELVVGRSTVVSFNGKSFDMPLLETRYRMQKLETPFAQMLHIDLLHVCRRFWKGRFDDNTLQTLERELLGVYRLDDTPGYLIPQLYFDYLATGNAQPLAGVLLHNRLDIVTLLFLLDSVERYLGEAEQRDFYSPVDALRIAKHHLRAGERRAARCAAERQFRGKIECDDDRALAMQLYRLQKQAGDFTAALSTLGALASCRGEIRLLALNESAMILERHHKDHAAAGKLVVAALEYLDNPLAEISYERVLFWSETLQKRRQRLLKRLG